MKNISLIVTIYNKRDYLKECVESLLKQGYPALEILLVDDGSTDGCGELAEVYGRQDSRVRVLHQKNGGETAARKAGLAAALGDYVLFVDADDRLATDAVSAVMARAARSGADIVTAAWILHDGGTERLETGEIEEGIYLRGENKERLVSRMIYCGDVRTVGINASLNTKLFRREFIREVLSRMPEGIAYAEDDFATYAALALAESVEVTHLPLYHYVMRYDSVSHSRDDWYLRDLNQGYLFFREMVRGLSEAAVCMRQMEIYMQRAVFFGMGKYLGFSEEMSVSWYRFPAAGLPDGARVAIYGAGKVGRCYHRQFQGDPRYAVVLWADLQAEKYRMEGLAVELPEKLREVETDAVVIAVESGTLATRIRRSLIERYGVKENTVYWEKPENTLDDAFSLLLREAVG